MPEGGQIVEFERYRLDIGRRLLTRDAQTITLQPKTFELLQLLINSQGRAISKDDLMGALWPDTSVQEASLTFQVSALRKALGDPAAQWIESVPRHGYRFTAQVTAPRKSRQAPSRWRTAIGVSVLAGIALGAVAWLLAGRRSEQPGAKGIPVTAYPGMEIHPSLSPDGSQVAFSWNGPHEDNFDIYVKLTGPGEPVRLTSDLAPDFAPAWSPDGQWIAYLRGPVGTMVSVFVMPALGGAERKVTEVYQPAANILLRKGTPNANLAWTPDSKRLAVTGGLEHVARELKVLLVDVESGETRPLTEPPPKWLGDFGPAFTADGRMLAFVRVRGLTLGELWVVPLSKDFSPAGEARRVTSARSIGEPRWIPGTRDIVFSSGSGLGQRRLYRVSTQESMPKHGLLAFGEDATGLSISKNGKVIYGRSRSDSNIWLLDSRQSSGNPKRVIASTLDDREPDFSPDGSRIVFTSTRSGTDEIWMSNADGSNPQKLTNMNGPLTSNPQWSPDGSEIVFDSRTPEAAGLYMLDPKTLKVRPFCSRGGQARWSRDGKWIYFDSGRTGSDEIWKTPRESCDAVRVTHGGGFAAQESPDGNYIYYSKGRPTSLWRMTPGGGPEERIAENISYSTSFDVTHDGVYFISSDGQAETATLRFFDARSRKTTVLLDTGKRWYFGIAAAPNGREILYSVIDSQGSDLMYVDSVP